MGLAERNFFKYSRGVAVVLLVCLAGLLQGCLQSELSPEYPDTPKTTTKEGTFLDGTTSSSDEDVTTTLSDVDLTTAASTVTATTTTLTATATQATTVDSTWSFAGITSAVSFRVGEVDVSWPAAVSSSDPHQRFEYFLAYCNGSRNLSVENILNTSDVSDEVDDDTQDVLVLPLRDQLNASLKNLTPNATVSLLAVAAPFGQDEMSTDQQTIHIVIASADSILVEGMSVVPVAPSDDFEVHAGASNISFFATGSGLPAVSNGSCVTGTDSSGTSFFVIVENISVQGDRLVADTRPAALTDIYKQLQIDTTVSLPVAAEGSRRLADLQKVHSWSILENANLELGTGVNLAGELRGNVQVRMSISIVWPGIVNSIVITVDFGWSLRSVVSFNMMSMVFNGDVSLSLPMPRIPPIPTPVPGVWIQINPFVSFGATATVQAMLTSALTIELSQMQRFEASFHGAGWEVARSESQLTKGLDMGASLSVFLSSQVFASFGLEVLLSGLLGLELEVAPSVSAELTASVASDNIIKELLPEGKVDDFGLTFDLDLNTYLICAGVVDKLGLCQILVGSSRKQLLQWNVASLPILRYPRLEMISVGDCVVRVEERDPSIGAEVTSQRWLLESPLVQMSGGASEVSLRFGDTLPRWLGKIYHVASLQLFGISLSKVLVRELGSLEIDCLSDTESGGFDASLPSCGGGVTSCVDDALQACEQNAPGPFTCGHQFDNIVDGCLGTKFCGDAFEGCCVTTRYGTIGRSPCQGVGHGWCVVFPDDPNEDRTCPGGCSVSYVSGNPVVTVPQHIRPEPEDGSDGE